MKKTEIQHIPPVKGAAEYFAGLDYAKPVRNCVIMKDTDGVETIIEYAKTDEQARKKAARWQKKENAAINKNK